MKVLGISPLDKDSTVTLMEDGRVLYAAAEERFTRTKLQDGFPWRALNDALSTTGVRVEEIDRVTYPFFTWEQETQLFRRNLAAERLFLDDSDSFVSGDLVARAGPRRRDDPWTDASERTDEQGRDQEARVRPARERRRCVEERGEARLG